MAASLDFPPDRELRPGASTRKMTCYDVRDFARETYKRIQKAAPRRSNKKWLWKQVKQDMVTCLFMQNTWQWTVLGREIPQYSTIGARN